MQSVAEKYARKAIDRLNQAGYAPVQITVEVGRLRPGFAGVAWPAERRIVISKDFLHEFPHEVQEETIPHEVCHIYQEVYYPNAKQRHGPEFRRLMQLIGCSGKTHHAMVLSKSNSNRRRNQKVRFVYRTVSTHREVLLTRAQHTKQTNWARMSNGDLGISLYRFKGENLEFCGSTKVIK